MSAPSRRRTAAAARGPGRVTQARVVVLSEWTKLRSLRSTRWSLLVAVVLTIGLPLPVRRDRLARTGAHMSPRERAQPQSARHRARRRRTSRSSRSACSACS